MNRVVSAIILPALIVPALAACKQGAVDPGADGIAIKAVENAMRDAYQARDAAKLASLYAGNATLYAPGERARAGNAAIAKGFETDLADPAFHITFTTGMVAVAASGDTGYSKGSFTLRFTDPKTKAPSSFSGYYLTLFAKQADGSWKVIEDMVSPAS